MRVTRCGMLLSTAVWALVVEPGERPAPIRRGPARPAAGARRESPGRLRRLAERRHHRHRDHRRRAPTGGQRRRRAGAAALEDCADARRRPGPGRPRPASGPSAPGRPTRCCGRSCASSAPRCATTSTSGASTSPATTRSIVRAYNDAVVYRFATKLPGDIEVLAEEASFRFAADHPLYFPEETSFISHQERLYKRLEAQRDRARALLVVAGARRGARGAEARRHRGRPARLSRHGPDIRSGGLQPERALPGLSDRRWRR